MSVWIPGMKPFIPDSDMPEFEDFLESIGLGSSGSSNIDFSGAPSGAYRYGMHCKSLCCI